MLDFLPQISHDYETYSEVDLKVVGAWAYSQHPSTEVVSWAMAVEDEDPILWLPGEEYPDIVLNSEDYIWFAWNNWFEHCIRVNTLKLPALPIENQVCTQALALALALPHSLGKCAEVLGFEGDEGKDKRGKQLIQKLSKPRKCRKTGDLIRNRDPELLQEFYEYNKQDVIVERKVKNMLRPLIPKERRLWEVDFDINIRGVPLDNDLLVTGERTYEKLKKSLKTTLIERTGLANPASNPQFKGWMEAQGHPLPNLQKATINDFLATLDPVKDKELIKTVSWRQALSRTPLTKFGAMRKQRGTDGRFHGALGFHVATTGRWSSSGVNFQNLNHPSFKEQEEIEQCIEIIKMDDPEFFSMMYEDPVDAMISCLRGIMRAEPGNKLIVADYKSIEARVQAWLAQDENKLEIFRKGQDVYKITAMKVFNIEDMGDVTYDQRQGGKVSELACGFGGAHNALFNMAGNLGIDLAVIAENLGFDSDMQFAKYIVKSWREANKPTKRIWKVFERMALRAINNPGKRFEVNKYVSFKMIPGMLLMRLPSGREIAFFGPKISEGRYGPQISYWCVNSLTKKWSKKYTHGGDIFQSAVQGIARDFMAFAILNLDDKGYKPVMLVHDEIITEVPQNFGSLAEMISIMCKLPPWGEGMPLNADGFEAIRYQKG